MSRPRTDFRAAAVQAAAAILMLTSGCGGPPQVSGPNRSLIVSLATAVSTRDAAGIESHARIVERRRSEGLLSGAENEAFRRILSKAESGDWESAMEEAYALRDAQAPSAEDVENVSRRKLAPGQEVPKTLRNSGRR